MVLNQHIMHVERIFLIQFHWRKLRNLLLLPLVYLILLVNNHLVWFHVLESIIPNRHYQFDNRLDQLYCMCVSNFVCVCLMDVFCLRNWRRDLWSDDFNHNNNKKQPMKSNQFSNDDWLIDHVMIIIIIWTYH